MVEAACTSAPYCKEAIFRDSAKASSAEDTNRRLGVVTNLMIESNRYLYRHTKACYDEIMCRAQMT
jgi:hypothetical protein